jgi:NADH-quinone oxidoreductase subunit N
VKAKDIKQSDTPQATSPTELFTRVALALCTAGIVLFGICSCLYDYLFSVSKSVM